MFQEVKEQLKQLNTEINQTSLELQAQTIKIKSDVSHFIVSFIQVALCSIH